MRAEKTTFGNPETTRLNAAAISTRGIKLLGFSLSSGGCMLDFCLLNLYIEVMQQMSLIDKLKQQVLIQISQRKSKTNY